MQNWLFYSMKELKSCAKSHFYYLSMNMNCADICSLIPQTWGQCYMITDFSVQRKIMNTVFSVQTVHWNKSVDQSDEWTLDQQHPTNLKNIQLLCISVLKHVKVAYNRATIIFNHTLMSLNPLELVLMQQIAICWDTLIIDFFFKR